jgi:hypothetical protein
MSPIGPGATIGTSGRVLGPTGGGVVGTTGGVTGSSGILLEEVISGVVMSKKGLTMSRAVTVGKELDRLLVWLCEVISVRGESEVLAVLMGLLRRSIGIGRVDYLNEIFDRDLDFKGPCNYFFQGFLASEVAVVVLVVVRSGLVLMFKRWVHSL